ncbi:TonB-dependent receptor [Algivirga pacifica]|uniref:TonB-dependent receptor n=2 Tax=Algivirga pacifica TaxID=1162670 RepID=A0ABP9DNL4_9BACT
MMALEMEGNFIFTYSPDFIIPQLNKPTIILNQEPLKKALDILFDTRYFGYEVLDEETVIIFTKKKLAREAPKTIQGVIKDAQTGETLVRAVAMLADYPKGTITDRYGLYKMKLPMDQYTLQYSHLGYKSQEVTFDLTKDTMINVQLEQVFDLMDTLVVNGLSMDLLALDRGQYISTDEIRLLSSPLGEGDISRSIQKLPGVQSQHEGAAGYAVRGGGTGQNLILMDGAPIYNVSHLLGFYSVFNPNIVKDITFYKSGMPASYGGRLSSIMDVVLRDGNQKRLGVSGGLGTMSGNLTVEGPLFQLNEQTQPSSFILSGRRSYLDLFYPPRDVTGDGINDTNVLNYYDLNFKANIYTKGYDRLMLSVYTGRDNVGIKGYLTGDWGNDTFMMDYRAGVKEGWLTSTSKLWYTNYETNTLVNFIDAYSYRTSYGLSDWGVRQDFNIDIDQEAFSLNAGVEAISHTYKFGEVTPLTNSSNFEQQNGVRVRALESTAYLDAVKYWGDRWSLNAGLRYIRFDSFEKERSYLYDVDPVVAPETSIENIVDTVFVDGKYEIAQTYHRLSPRISAKYRLGERSYLNMALDVTHQFIHQLSISSLPTPTTGFWVPSDRYIRPQRAVQLAASWKKYWKEIWQFEVGGYYKDMDNQLDFKPNSGSSVTDHIETDVLQGRGYAYGLELMGRIQKGKWLGEVAYTYAVTRREIDGINDGNPYPTDFDRKHDFFALLNFDVTRKIDLTAQWVYASGLAYTFPVGKYEYNGTPIPLYSERNSFRLPSTHRLDLSCTLYRTPYVKEGSGKRKNENNFRFAIYNVYGRKNTLAYVFRQSANDPSKTEAVKLYLFSILPSFSYNFKF